MDTKRFVQLWGITIAFFLIIDGLWLFFASGFYGSQLGYLMAENLRWGSAFLFYALFTFGLTFFVIYPHRVDPVRLENTLKGGFFALVAYGTYDLTNQATIAEWPTIVTVVDMCWSILLGSLVTYTTLFVVQKWMYR